MSIRTVHEGEVLYICTVWARQVAGTFSRPCAPVVRGLQLLSCVHQALHLLGPTLRHVCSEEGAADADARSKTLLGSMYCRPTPPPLPFIYVTQSVTLSQSFNLGLSLSPSIYGAQSLTQSVGRYAGMAFTNAPVAAVHALA